MYIFFKRIFDVLSSLIVLVVLFPVFIIISILIVLNSRGGVFYLQVRVGKDEKNFKLIKFRSMRRASDKSGQLTVGNDLRVTSIGKFIRRSKIDEFPQLLNVIAGDMSVVGPRPEVPKYVKLYTTEQKEVLRVKPGLTDYASIEYMDEQVILGKSDDPEQTYIKEIMPAKLKLNLKYISERNFFLDLKLIMKTILKIF